MKISAKLKKSIHLKKVYLCETVIHGTRQKFNSQVENRKQMWRFYLYLPIYLAFSNFIQYIFASCGQTRIGTPGLNCFDVTLLLRFHNTIGTEL